MGFPLIRAVRRPTRGALTRAMLVSGLMARGR
jgi:hypothetical protein